MSIHGVGIDVADTHRFFRLVERRGDSFTAKWFTAEEIAQCHERRGDRGARALAARYAAKEAVWKALGPEDWSAPLPWREIAVLDAAAPGRLEVRLSGGAAELARRLGVDSVEVALCPGRPDGPAIAVAVAGRRTTLPSGVLPR
ncbi:4'-phosphopantetheinyl transferase superfamily protein [Nocardioides sp. CER19]|uniref:holo-ACP synthase n=1 Tax=Nocardioides sp. CER19 TaxID=3038538 RepID=UPI00244CC500|nr:4'-phosphopantetheinyl transferase superfamily protein [Nocardioides sp. CER19]MDH2414811.1 4'-phosphopantetheinyl transferase superfamily protein [Nocardioides sp. CER19]